MMELDRHRPSTTTKIALAAVFAALVFIVTSQIPPISIPATSGYFNLGETIIYVSALLFGPLPGFLAGGVGSMLADLYLGFTFFAPGTLIIKGIEGTIVGFLNLRLKKLIPNITFRASLSVLVGGLEMVFGYFIYEQLALGYPTAAALVEVPFNLVQMAIGLIVALPIMHAVRRVYPSLNASS